MSSQDAKTPEQLREEIEQTRQELGATVEELSAKTDVKAQVHAHAEEFKSSVSDRRDAVIDTAREAVPGSAQEGLQQAGTAVKRRPVPASALAGFVGGVLVGWLLARR
jgi:ElaB/YqjD/DUF883 family membrane-anchored ribosome-binding protein